MIFVYFQSEGIPSRFLQIDIWICLSNRSKGKASCFSATSSTSFCLSVLFFFADWQDMKIRTKSAVIKRYVLFIVFPVFIMVANCFLLALLVKVHF